MKLLHLLILDLLLVFAFTNKCASQQRNLYLENIAIANELLENGQYKEAAKSYSSAFKSNNNLGRADHRYDAARAWAMAGEIDSAFFQLEKAVKGNFTGYAKMYADPDFKLLRSDTRWTKVLSSIRQNWKKLEEMNNPGFKDLNQDLIIKLESIQSDDQLPRSKSLELEKKYGLESIEVKNIYAVIAKKDSLNLIKVNSIIDQYGWLGKEDIGERGNETLFLVIQHANLNTWRKYLPVVRDAVKHGKANPSHLALLEDRLAIAEGRKQIYGSQLIQDSTTGKYYVREIADPEHVDKRRASVGLNPMKDYVSGWGIQWSLEHYKKDLKESKKEKLTNK